jgi:hypothetical protein
VNIAFKGAGKVDPDGDSIILIGAPEKENSLARPAEVTPSTGAFAAASFRYRFPAYSASVLMIGF